MMSEAAQPIAKTVVRLHLHAAFPLVKPFQSRPPPSCDVRVMESACDDITRRGQGPSGCLATLPLPPQPRAGLVDSSPPCAAAPHECGSQACPVTMASELGANTSLSAGATTWLWHGEDMGIAGAWPWCRGRGCRASPWRGHSTEPTDVSTRRRWQPRAARGPSMVQTVGAATLARAEAMKDPAAPQPQSHSELQVMGGSCHGNAATSGVGTGSVRRATGGSVSSPAGQGRPRQSWPSNIPALPATLDMPEPGGNPCQGRCRTRDIERAQSRGAELAVPKLPWPDARLPRLGPPGRRFGVVGTPAAKRDSAPAQQQGQGGGGHH